MVVSRDHLADARELFINYGVTVTTSHRLLGGVIGDQPGSVAFVEGRVSEWLAVIEKSVLIAETQPQLSYCAYTRSVQSQWTYLQRVTPGCSSLFQGYNSLRNRDWQRTGSHVYTSVIFNNNNNNLFFERALDSSCTAACCCAARK